MSEPGYPAAGRHDVLVVNARVDEAWAVWCAGVLRGSGRSVAALQDGLGDLLDVRQVLEREVRAAGQVVVLLSRSGVGFLRVAVSVANALGRRVVPVHVDPRPVPYPAVLAHLAAVELVGVSLEEAERRLVAAADGSEEHRVRANRVRHRPPVPVELVGRDAELAGLAAAFEVPRPAVVVAGRSGVGTSALAAWFVRRYRERWTHVRWSSPARFAEDQLTVLTRPRGPSLLVVDGAVDYRSVRDALWPALLDRDLVHVLVTSPSGDWPSPFRVVGVAPLVGVAAERLVRVVLPELPAGDVDVVVRVVGGVPAAVSAVSGLLDAGGSLGELESVRDAVVAVGAAERGFYFLDSADPGVVGAFERAFADAAGGVERLAAGRSPWRRWWRRRCPAGAGVDPVAVVALARAVLVPRTVVLVAGSRVFVKAPRLGPGFTVRTLTSGRLRDFEHAQRLRRDPVAELFR
ncbi:toll/interleukin-1 receptor domain-containing protein [Actinophytocola gossypii]|uniref:Toll/interleukin-1 receptor domain-containing protein n=1 Tax=Actinophytocola gossypii TaxID=2812003 RepID=A0ABT2J1K3_9PSEU|nr:toll/interleukin-1 receptor domain-containing protein [Actinophytocola gossypii]MCT2581641.1 toll/interleukin-1 receptor domain-containing protein [Actinophytocola gossypii]